MEFSKLTLSTGVVTDGRENARPKKEPLLIGVGGTLDAIQGI